MHEETTKRTIPESEVPPDIVEKFRQKQISKISAMVAGVAKKTSDTPVRKISAIVANVAKKTSDTSRGKTSDVDGADGR